MSEDQKMIPMIQAEKIIMHQNFANRRMLIALLAVCITFILTIIIFVVGYTIRERNWLDTIISMNQSSVTEVADGVQQSADS